MILEHSNYRSFLKAVFADKSSEREGCSLRAFAQKLGFANSHLSEVLGGKKPLSTDGALRIALKLNLSEIESQYFCLLVQLESETDPEHRIVIQDRLDRISKTRITHDLSSEAFRVISDWYHFAILELTYVAGFKLTPVAAATRLGISKPEADSAIERLLRLELLEVASDGNLRKTQGYVVAQSDTLNAGLRKYHRQLLDKAHACFDREPTHERVNCSQIMPIDSRDLARARALTDRYLSEMATLAERAAVKDEVYCLSTHFFKLTHSPSPTPASAPKTSPKRK